MPHTPYLPPGKEASKQCAMMPEGTYQASITAVGNTAVIISKCGSASSYQGVDFQWPELATFVKQATLTVTSQEARYHPKKLAPAGSTG